MQKDIKMSAVQHLEELRQKILYSVLVSLILAIITFFNVDSIIKFLQQPASGIKFLQLAPGEYFFSTIKVSFYSGIIFSIPFWSYQIMVFVFPALTKKESNYLIPLILISVVLFLSGLLFSYLILIPAALRFFINYGSNFIQPLWSFEEYLNFILLLLVSTGIIFQIPILQVIVGILKVVSVNKMLSIWKYVVVISTILGAIVTPSTDPITQMLLSFAVLLLYLIGILSLVFLETRSYI
uniref:Sec-independent periplasmic protein translocase n=1 Tax=Boldia erythrosiphon TaxID=74908 RepID=A0A1Y9TLP2_9RHOD|nr:sec-independent periplasmic protein translocase [Boldia erythrosiphon]ARO90535.1 sec-independent periplasmic protein translocase [Boldia erythrosiphon]